MELGKLPLGSKTWIPGRGLDDKLRLGLAFLVVRRSIHVTAIDLIGLALLGSFYKKHQPLALMFKGLVAIKLLVI